MVEIVDFLHASLLVADLPRARRFYEGVLGLKLSSRRPSMDFDGVWYDIGRRQIHLLALPSPEVGLIRPDHGGRDRHLALSVVGVSSLRAALDREGIPYTLSASGRQALFCRDPDGNALEFIEMPKAVAQGEQT